MNLYIYIDGSDLEEIADAISSSISDWLSQSKAHAELINQVGVQDIDLPDQRLGINLKISKGRELKEPLNLLYGLAKEHKRDFVLGIVNIETDLREDICYFGNEEGKPDFYEISSYLGVKV